MSINLQDLLKKRVELQNKSGSGNFMKLADGVNVVRVISYKDYPWYKETGSHYIITPDGESKAVACRRQEGYSDCYLCEVADKLSRGTDEERAEAKKLKSKYKVYMNVIDRKENTVKVLGVGITVFKSILDLIIDPDWGDMTDPTNGYDIAISKSGKGLETEYSVTPKPRRCAYGVTVDDSTYVDLDTVVKIPSYYEQKSMFLGEEEAQVEEMPPAKPVSKPKPEVTAKVETTKAEPVDKQLLEDEIQKALAKYRKG